MTLDNEKQRHKDIEDRLDSRLLVVIAVIQGGRGTAGSCRLLKTCMRRPRRRLGTCRFVGSLHTDEPSQMCKQT